MLATFTHTKFKRDIARGSLFEDYVEEYFKKRGWTVHRARGKIPAYDLIITRGTSSIYIECKYDEMSDLTGNYCLEKASLDHTKSSVLIIGTPKEAYALPMDIARALFNQYPKRQTGDLANNYSALIPKSVFKTNGYQRL